MPNKLERLLIGEVSAVDDPANQSPGWLLMKSRGDIAALAEDDVVNLAGIIENNILTALEKRDVEGVNMAVAALLENFSKLTPEMKRTVLDSLRPETTKALRNAFLLAQSTADVPTAEDGIFARALKRPVIAR